MNRITPEVHVTTDANRSLWESEDETRCDGAQEHGTVSAELDVRSGWTMNGLLPWNSGVYAYFRRALVFSVAPCALHRTTPGYKGAQGKGKFEVGCNTSEAAVPLGLERPQRTAELLRRGRPRAVQLRAGRWDEQGGNGQASTTNDKDPRNNPLPRLLPRTDSPLSVLDLEAPGPVPTTQAPPTAPPLPPSPDCKSVARETQNNEPNP